MEVELTKRDQKRREKKINEIIEMIDNALNSVGEKLLRNTVDFSFYQHPVDHMVRFSTESGRTMAYGRFSHIIRDRSIYKDVLCSHLKTIPQDQISANSKVFRKAYKTAMKASIVVEC